MGISLGTYAVAAGVDAGKVKSNQEKLVKLQAEHARGNQELREERDAQVQSLKANSTVCPSENVISDLVTSGEGTSLHRLQFTVWTLALMVVFVVTVWTTLQMPDFDSTLLALMGISSGAYAGLKVGENKR